MGYNRTINYKDNITKLIKLQKSDRTEFDKLLKIIQKEESINGKPLSKATVYRDMGDARTSKLPGARKRRKDAGKPQKPLSKKETAVFKEAVKSLGSKKAAGKLVEEMTGKKTTMSKQLKLNKTTKGKKNDTAVITEMEIVDNEPEEQKSNFGSKAKKFIDKIFEMDLIAPDSGLEFDFRGFKVFLTKDEIHDVAMILATAYNRKVENKDMVAVDRNALLKSEIFYTVQELHRIAKTSMSIKDVETCTKILKQLDASENIVLPNDFNVYYAALRTIKPDLTRKDAVQLLKQHLPKR